jgi:hypothetical protein
MSNDFPSHSEDSRECLQWRINARKPSRLVSASDYPQDFTGVNTDTGKWMKEFKNYRETIRNLPLDQKSKEKILGDTAAVLLKLH